MNIPLEFFRAVHGTKDLAHWTVVWYLPAKHCVSNRDHEPLANWVSNMSTYDVFMGVCPTAQEMKGKSRGGSADAAALLNLWADIDIAGPEHKSDVTGKVYPPDEGAARRILELTTPQPNVVVHSGHGLQAYWRLPEPYAITTAADRARATWMAAGWQREVARVARELGGWDVDSVGDLARVMRVPGTMNNKGAPVEVRLLWTT